MRASLWALMAAGLAGCSCGEDRPCGVTDGRYLAYTPDAGASPWPVWVHLHGGGGSAETFADNDALREAAASRGYLLVLPEAVGGTWRLQLYTEEQWAQVPWSDDEFTTLGRDDQDYIAEVLDDVSAGWEVDPDRVLVSGFSIGGSMTWDLVCLQGERFAAAAPIAGGFWDPLPARCPGEPVPMLHSHGTADETVPLGGRAFTEDIGQGNIADGWAVLTERAGCEAGTETVTDAPLTCSVGVGCDVDMRMCLHDGGHTPPSGWATRSLDWFEALE